MLCLVGAEKGGTGKTTLAVNLAAMCALAGHDTLLVDTDSQGSASIWSAARSEGGVSPEVICMSKHGKVGFDLAKLKDKFPRIIVDAGGRDSMELRQSMAVCDVMIMPFRPSQFDTWSLDRMVQLMRDIEERVGERVNAKAMLNAVSTNPQVTEEREMRGVLADYAEYFPVLWQAVADRIAFRRAARDGLCVTELKGPLHDAKASAEMAAIYQEVFSENFASTQKPSAAAA